MSSESRRVRAPNLRLRWHREARNWSQEDLAAEITKAASERVVCDVRQVARWEGGEVLWPHRTYRTLLEEVFGVSIAELGFFRSAISHTPGLVVAQAIVEPFATAAGGMDQVERREFLGGATAFVGGPFVDRLVGELDGATPRITPGSIGKRQVEQVVNATRRLQSIDDRVGGLIVYERAAQYMDLVRGQLERCTYSDEVGSRLRSAAGELAAFGGFVAYDAGRQKLARSHFGEGLYFAQFADDKRLEIQVYSYMSNQARRTGYPREAVQIAQRAQTLARHWGSPRIRSLLHMREAYAWSTLQERTAMIESVRRAWAEIERARQGDDDPSWVSFVDPSEIMGLEALCRVELADYAGARELTRQSLAALDADLVRNRALYQAYLAFQTLCDGEVESACAAAQESVELDVASERVWVQLHVFRRSLEKYGKEPAAVEFLALIDNKRKGVRP